jgi:protein O-GlcNAc transferase
MTIQQAENAAFDKQKVLAAEAAALRAAGKLKEAAEAYRRFVATDGGPVAFNELCLVLSDLGRNEQALDVIEGALSRHPDHLQLIAQRGVILERLRRHAEAIDVYGQVLLHDPNLVPILNNLAGLLNLLGRHDEAIDLFRRSLAIESNPANHSNLLFAMNYSGCYNQRLLFAEHKRWAAQYAPAYSDIEPFANSRDPDRGLRWAMCRPILRCILSPFSIGAVIANHDRTAIEVFCYSATFAPDEMTNTLRRMNVVWRDIAALDDASAAQLIRNDGIDIAVDLSGHTAGNRLMTLARRPAPIQASYLGYPNTTGMQAIGYRFTDAWADPPGASDTTHSETLIRLPQGFLAYTPPANMPPVRDLPARIGGRVTFGSFSNLAKISPETIGLWSRVLAEVPDAQLMIKAHNFADEAARERFRRLFASHGVSGDRLMLPSEPRRSVEHFDTLNRIDIALDTVPYNGTTTTCEALWMGVPVVALAGDRHASRVGVSILNAAGLPELIAPTPNTYIAIARRLAGDLDGLAALRGSLRTRLAGSALLDARRLARALEVNYGTVWRTWCANAGAGADHRKQIQAKEPLSHFRAPGSGGSDPDRAYGVALQHYKAGRL